MRNKTAMDLPLIDVLRPEFALPLQHVMRLYTVGNFLRAWKTPKSQRSIEHIFDSPSQARHAAQVCSTWIGNSSAPTVRPVSAWWRGDDKAHAAA